MHNLLKACSFKGRHGPEPPTGGGPSVASFSANARKVVISKACD